MSGMTSGGSAGGSLTPEDPNMKAYVTTTSEGQQYSELYQQLAARGFAYGGTPQEQQFIGAFMKWQQTQKSGNEAWGSYAKLAAEEQGRGQTILTGAAQTQYSSLLASMGNPIGAPITATPSVRGNMGG